MSIVRKSSAWPESRLRYLLSRPPVGERIRRLSNASEVTFIPMEAIGEDGSLDLSLKRDLKEVSTGYTEFCDGDVLVAKITPCFENGKGALVSGLLHGCGFGTTELHVLTPGPKVEARFLYYVTASARFRKLGEPEMVGAAGQKRVPEEFVQNYRIAVPPLPEQRVICDYLDQEIRKLDTLIAAKERLLRLITQKRQALVTRAATQGLDPCVRLHDSQIPWLGKVPAGWEVERAKWLFTERDERSTTGEEELLTVSHVTGVTRRAEKDVSMFQAETTEGYKICYKGDLVINTLWAWMGAMGVSPIRGVVSPAYNVYIPNERLDPAYIDAIVRIGLFAQEAARHSKGVWSSRLRLYPENFFEIWMPVPPIKDQQEIVSYIRIKESKLQELTIATERTMSLLKERRGALITAAVSGQLG